MAIGKNAGLPVLSSEFNDGYRKAIFDIMNVFKGINQDLSCHHMKMNYKWVEKVLQCFLDNREKFRDDFGDGDGFIRLIRDEKGKWDNVKYFSRSESRQAVIDLIFDELTKVDRGSKDE